MPASANGPSPPGPLRDSDALLEIALSFGAELDLDRLTDLVLERTIRLLGAQRAALVQLDRDGTIRDVVGRNADGTAHDPKLSRSMIRDAYELGRIQVLCESPTPVVARRSVQEMALQFVTTLPVKTSRGTVAVLYADSRRRPKLTSPDSSLHLEAIARLVGTALENASLFEEQKARAELLAAMAHDLRSNLQVALLGSTELARELVAESERREIAAHMLGSLRWMARLVRNTVDLSAATRGDPPTPVRFSPAAIVREHIAANRILLAERNLEPRVVETQRIEVASVPDWFRIAVDNLVGNALRYAEDGSRVTVAFRLRDDAGPVEGRHRAFSHLFRGQPPYSPRLSSGFCEMSVHNLGPPIPEQLRDSVFEAWTSGNDSEGNHGLGLGIAAACIRQIGGRVWFESDNDIGTRFTLSIPIEVFPS